MKSQGTGSLFDRVAADAVAPEAPSSAAGQRAKAKYKKPVAASLFPDMEKLDPVVYGLRRPMSGEDLRHLSDHMSGEDFELWKLRNLPLRCQYTPSHFTPRGKVLLLRERRYTDAQIARMYPELSPHLEDRCLT